jgi:hypothetical protein
MKFTNKEGEIMKTFEVKFYYSGYDLHRVKAETEEEAYQKAEAKVGSGLFENVNPDRQAAFLDTMNRWPEADEVMEVDPEAPIDEDRITFGPPVFPGGRDVLILDPEDSLIDRMIEKEG